MPIKNSQIVIPFLICALHKEIGFTVMAIWTLKLTPFTVTYKEVKVFYSSINLVVSVKCSLCTEILKFQELRIANSVEVEDF